MKSTDLFVAQVIPHVYGCSDPMAKQAVIETAIEFCQRTNAVWQSANISTVANQAVYDIDVPAQMQTNKILELYYSTTRLRAYDATSMDDVLAWRGEVDDQEPTTGDPLAFFAVEGESTFSVYPVPETATTDILTCKASFVPLRSASQLDDLLYNRYLSTIRSGAIAFLTAMPGQPFTSLSMHEMHRQQFERGVSRALAESRKGAAVTSTRVRARAFA